MLGFVFIQSHNGMEVFSDKRDFVRSQLASTRNIHASLFNDWFTGGLNRQIEHHLFPTLPRHNLRKAQERVRALCAKHGLFYEVRGLYVTNPTLSAEPPVTRSPAPCPKHPRVFSCD